jgi:hypothetical protein
MWLLRKSFCAKWQLVTDAGVYNMEIIASTGRSEINWVQVAADQARSQLTYCVCVGHQHMTKTLWGIICCDIIKKISSMFTISCCVFYILSLSIYIYNVFYNLLDYRIYHWSEYIARMFGECNALFIW